MIRRPPRSTRTAHSFPTRRSSDLAYRRLNLDMLKESVYLAAKTSAMVCWLFVGSSIFSAAFALLGGQELINNWVLGMDLTPVQFLILAQIVIFLLGWPLEWTEDRKSTSLHSSQ